MNALLQNAIKRASQLSVADQKELAAEFEEKARERVVLQDLKNIQDTATYHPVEDVWTQMDEQIVDAQLKNDRAV